MYISLWRRLPIKLSMQNNDFKTLWGCESLSIHSATARKMLNVHCCTSQSGSWSIENDKLSVKSFQNNFAQSKMFGNQSLFNLFHVLKNGLRTCDLCGSYAVVYQLLVILLPATGIWGFPVVTVHVKFITPMIFYLPYLRKADIFSHTWRWVIVSKVRQVLRDLTRIFTMLLLKVWSFCQVVFLIRRENVCAESLCAHVQLFLQHRRFHCHFAWFPWWFDP